MIDDLQVFLQKRKSVYVYWICFCLYCILAVAFYYKTVVLAKGFQADYDNPVSREVTASKFCNQIPGCKKAMIIYWFDKSKTHGEWSVKLLTFSNAYTRTEGYNGAEMFEAFRRDTPYKYRDRFDNFVVTKMPMSAFNRAQREIVQ